jgi:F-type H+-transporting ATPase subunit epsilon
VSKTYHAQILTPEGTLYDGDVTGVQVPGKSGTFLMLYDHAPIVSTLDVGQIVIKKADESETVYAVSGGFVEMNDNHLTLLAEKAEEASQIDIEKAKRLEADAKERLKDVKNDREKALRDLKIAKNKIKTASGE